MSGPAPRARHRVLIVGATPARSEALRRGLLGPELDLVVAERDRLGEVLVDAAAHGRPFAVLVLGDDVALPVRAPLPVVVADARGPEVLAARVRRALSPRAAQAAQAAARPPSDLDLSRPFRELKREAVATFERRYVEALVAHHQGNLAAAARAAGVDRKNLWTLARKYGIDLRAARRARARHAVRSAP